MRSGLGWGGWWGCWDSWGDDDCWWAAAMWAAEAAVEVEAFGGNPLMSTLPLAIFWEAVTGPEACDAWSRWCGPGVSCDVEPPTPPPPPPPPPPKLVTFVMLPSLVKVGTSVVGLRRSREPFPYCCQRKIEDRVRIIYKYSNSKSINMWNVSLHTTSIFKNNIKYTITRNLRNVTKYNLPR